MSTAAEIPIPPIAVHPESPSLDTDAPRMAGASHIIDASKCQDQAVNGSATGPILVKSGADLSASIHAGPNDHAPVAEGSRGGGVAEEVEEPRTPSPLSNDKSHPAQGVNGQPGERHEMVGEQQSRKEETTLGSVTPTERRSVQFVRQPTSTEQADHLSPLHIPTSEEGTGDGASRDRRGFTLFSKLKSFAAPSGLQGHGRSQSGYTVGDDSMYDGATPEPMSPATQRDALRSPRGVADAEERGQEPDTDVEETTGDERAASYFGRTRRGHGRRRSDEGPSTAPTTPRALGFLRRDRDQISPADDRIAEDDMPNPIQRRATITDIGENRRSGPEEEGRDRLDNNSSWRARMWHRGTSHGAASSSADARRPSNFRRLTTWAGGADTTPTGTPTAVPRWRTLESNLTMSASRWRALKAGLRMMGPRRKEEHKYDHAKSAELLAELAAGAPAAIILASMFQRDDHGHKRIPVLLEQLKVKLTDSKKIDQKGPGDRHQVFRIELEYGSGLTRMKWVIHRSLRDFTNLHVRYKLQSSSEKYKHLAGREDPSRPKIPRFPRTAFPFLRGVRGLGSEDEDDGDDLVDDEAASNANVDAAPGVERRPKTKKKRPSLNRIRRASLPARSDSHDANAGQNLDSGQTPGPRREPYPERQRKKLEQYLQQLIRHLMFRADSSRLCKFLELSSLGIRLAAEGSYHGKEGFLIIQSAKGLDFRKAWRASFIASRHAPKWFLVRHSYVVCVDSPEEMNVYDVFLVDSDFDVQCQKGRLRDQKRSKKPKDVAIIAKHRATRAQHHLLKLRNSERKLRLLAKNERQLGQFEESIQFMMRNTIWSKTHRFGSFAPVRSGVFAQWLVDGRDYMWNVSRAISMARDVVYIHDWWLSPELYMRRPAAISRKWRLDRLLQRKAAEGVKVFVILYRNINSAIPIDSTYTKFSLLDLHQNIFVQRSPNQFRQNTFFWAHHEKICIVDHTVAFVGGIDLCFGRWDTPQHSVCDDKLTGFEQSDAPKDADHCQLWPGKDYSNPRVQDFYALDKPYEEMYDRTNIPRMPWHDISMQIVGQPARDLTRHFVQRWNYVLRQRKPTRPTPFLLPPPDFNPADLETLGLDGTCEVQILRSCSWWSMGTPDRTEHSIMTAYVKMIQQSEHFVYMENQFFVSSCEVEGTVIENSIGQALVERATRAAKNGEAWRAVIIIPLMPGFQNTVDSQDGTSVRLIMQCQFRSICRGESSIWGKLRAQGIEPEDYIQFYSLRSWGKIGPSRMLVTEQLYIHAKCMIVDDRVAIIGSANINERSMRGDRDSECAAVVRDTDMLESSMNGKPYLVGRFPHTLRMRLMREHLGVDVDEVMEEEHEQELARMHEKSEKSEQSETAEDPSRGDSDAGSPQASVVDHETEEAIVASRHKAQDELIAKSEGMFSFNHDFEWEQANNPNLRSDKRLTEDKRVTGNAEHRKDVEGRGPDHMLDETNPVVDRGRDSAIVGGDREVLVLDIDAEGKGTLLAPKQSHDHDPRGDGSEDGGACKSPDLALSPVRSQADTLQVPGKPKKEEATVEDGTDVEGSPTLSKAAPGPAELANSLVAEMKRPAVGKDCMKDPISDAFYDDIWHTVAENNTKLFRYVFRCMPDNEVTNWKKYKEYLAYAERFAQAQGGKKSKERTEQESAGRSGPVGASSLPEKLATLAPIGEAVNGIQRGIGKLNDGAPNEKGGSSALGRIADWADEASRADTERHEKASEEQEGKPAATGRHLAFVDEKAALKSAAPENSSETAPSRAAAEDGDPEKLQRHNSPQNSQTTDSLSKNSNSQRRRRRATTRSSRKEFLASDDLMDKAEAEQLMEMVQGHLVLWPYDWLIREEQGGNWLYSIDQLAPLEIYD